MDFNMHVMIILVHVYNADTYVWNKKGFSWVSTAVLYSVIKEYPHLAIWQTRKIGCEIFSRKADSKFF